MEYDVIIIGSGLGGLQCGYMLAKKGFKVCVLEKNYQIGGCLQAFRRNGYTFDTGFHHVGSLGKGESLYWLLDQFNLMHLPWHQLDSDAFDEVFLDGKSYCLANGYEPFVEKLSEYFPHQHSNIKAYTHFLKQTNENLFQGLKHDLASVFQQDELIEKSAYQFVQQTIDDERLRAVLSGTSLKMELNAATLPLYIFAQINGSYIPSAWRLKGGGYKIAESLKTDILAMGGEVHVHTPVTNMEVTDKQITKIYTDDGECWNAQCVISDIHPASTLKLLNKEAVRKSFRSRISSLDNSFGIFTANIKLKDNTVPYLNRNLYIHRNADMWNPLQKGVHSAFVNFSVPESGNTTNKVDILTKMQWDEVSKWVGTAPNHRGQEYEEMKQRKCEELLDLVSLRLPELKNNIETIYTSTPLTYSDYIDTENGSAYGVRKDCNQLYHTILLTVTPVHNLFFTGQNINFHGIFGVSITTLQTCWMVEKFLKKDY